MSKSKINKWIFMSTVPIRNPDIEIIGDYNGLDSKINVRCKICGYEYFDTPQNILFGRLHKKGGKKCYFCKHQTYSQPYQQSIINNIKEAADNYMSSMDFLNYYNPDIPDILCRCKNCGKENYISLNDLANRKYFCDCKVSKEANTHGHSVVNNSKTQKRKLIIQQILIRSEAIILLSKDGSTLKCKCLKCGDIFFIEGYMNRKKIICPKCKREKYNEIKKGRRFEKSNSGYTSIRRKCNYYEYCHWSSDFICAENIELKTYEEKRKECLCFKEPYYKKSEFKNIVENANRYIELLDDYIDSYTKLKYRCKICGNEYYEKPYNLFYSKCGCRDCKKSFGEFSVLAYLEEHNLDYVTEKVFKDCKYEKYLRFDFYIESLNTIIEYEGKPHFEPLSFDRAKTEYGDIRKKIKDDYCKENGIDLIRIPYYCKDIDSFLNKNIKK